MRRKIILILFFHSFIFGVFSQNLDKLTEKDKVTVHGGIGFNTIGYGAIGIDPRREAFQWFASGNLNISILDVSLPFTYSYSNVGGNFTQPFNQTALHPTYKWMKSHLGITAMSFSQYTLSGHPFLGAGFELTPKKWDIKFMGGRLNKAIQYDPVNDNFNQFSYLRMGFGMSTGYTFDKGNVEFIAFKGYDINNSLVSMPQNSLILPQDNMVLSVKSKYQFYKSLSVEGEYAISALTNNIRLSDTPSPPSFFRFLNPFIQNNGSTGYYNAYKSSLNYQIKTFSIAASFEHVDPGYRTLGGYYFNNDFNNYTIAPRVSLFKNKLNINCNTGFQVNNLSEEKSATTSRWVGSFAVSSTPFKGFSTSINYSNFSTFTKNRPITDPYYFQPADTLNIYQLSENASALMAYSFGDKLKQSVTLMGLYQESTVLSGLITSVGAFGIGSDVESASSIPTKIYGANTAYNVNITKLEMSLSFAGNINHSVLPMFNTTFIGPTLSVSKSLFDKKLSLQFGTTYNQQYQENLLISNVFNYRLGLNHTPKFEKEKIGRMNISLNGNWMSKLPTANSIERFSEINVFFNIKYDL